jgi:thiol-disulfide isomerase/thioredoxin
MRPERFAILLATLAPLLLAGDAPPASPSPDGQELVGTSFPKLRFQRWTNTPDGKAPELEDHPVLYRWWTGGCSFCEKSLPAIESLRAKYGPDGLRVVAVYHPKPVRKVADAAIRAAAEGMGYGGAVAVDGDWSQLRRAWLDGGQRRATSVTFLVDRRGVVRFVHPGPALFPSDDPGDAEEARAFAALDRAIAELIEAPAD